MVWYDGYDEYDHEYDVWYGIWYGMMGMIVM